MKKRIRRLALLMAVVVCIAAFPQNMAKAEAATRSYESLSLIERCYKCQNPLMVIKVETSMAAWERTGKCTERAHVSLNCFLGTVTYRDTYYLE